MRIVLTVILIFWITVSYADQNKPLSLSLDEAILLAVRENPNVAQVELTQVMEKFALYVQQWQFMPHYSFQAAGQLTENQDYNGNTRSSVLKVQPGASLLSPIGTQSSLTSTNKYNHDGLHPGLTLQIMQPLMRGFGRPIVEAALYNAIDSVTISNLNIEGSLRYTITAVINAYLDVIAAEKNIDIDKEALDRAQVSVHQTQLYIKAGHKSGNELAAVEADVASAQTRLENDKNLYMQARYALLTAIGIDPNTNIRLIKMDLDNLIHKYHVPSREESVDLILENDIQYQVDKITLDGALKRNVMIAEDNTRWTLNVTGDLGIGNGEGPRQSSGFNSLLRHRTQTQSLSVSLTVPIDDQIAKQAVVNAKIALQQAQLALKQEKWGKETDAINGWNSVMSAERALVYAESSGELQAKTYQISFQKYKYGMIDSLELQTAQQQLITSDQTLLTARVAYIKALVNLDQLTGNTLNTWHIKVAHG